MHSSGARGWRADGPWNPWLHEPAIGKAIWDLTLAMTANASPPDISAKGPATLFVVCTPVIAAKRQISVQRSPRLLLDIRAVKSSILDRNVCRIGDVFAL